MENTHAEFHELEDIGSDWDCRHLAPCYEQLARLHAEGRRQVRVGSRMFGKTGRVLKNGFLRRLQEYTGFLLPVPPHEDFMDEVEGILCYSSSTTDGFMENPLPNLDEWSIIKDRLQMLDGQCARFLSRRALSSALA